MFLYRILQEDMAFFAENMLEKYLKKSIQDERKCRNFSQFSDLISRRPFHYNVLVVKVRSNFLLVRREKASWKN